MLNLASMPRHDEAHYSQWSSPAGMTEQVSWEQTLASIGLQRNKAAYALLFAHFAPRLKAFGIKLFGNEQQALEMVQDTMLNVWQKAALFDASRGAASTWIFTIARNVRFDMLRKKQRRKDDISADDLWFDGEYPEVELEQSDYHWDITLLLDKLAPHFAQLPPAQSEVITKVYLEEKTHQEVSDELSIPLGTVKSRLRLALDRLKEAFDGSHN
ncbi:sigma-70 family RNA polymerase sigma factor [Rheinheimera salexigens]|nr:sigma-70 family RNA polymerase sigma factor [Rheinheimera salexigens]